MFLALGPAVAKAAPAMAKFLANLGKMKEGRTITLKMESFTVYKM